MSVKWLAMLDDLRDSLDEIEATNEREYEFVTDLLIAKEEGRLGRLSSKQIAWLERMHKHYGC